MRDTQSDAVTGATPGPWRVRRECQEDVEAFLDDVQRLLNLLGHPFVRLPSVDELPALHETLDRIAAAIRRARPEGGAKS